MPKRDSRVDAYIAKSADFAKPILSHFRAIVDEACPDAAETIKWSTPSWDYAGSMLCSMAAFKQHCAFGFWKGKLFLPKSEDLGENAMGQFGRIASIDDLPSKKVLLGYIKQAVKLNEEGIKTPKRPKQEKAKLVVPAYFRAALKKNKQAQTTFDNFSPSQQREYVEWITEAKQEATRERRLATALQWLAEGKSKNWKYEKC
jgi:uncharacterized protein YdeI (YjbR/CyaY-like superfamily)